MQITDLKHAKALYEANQWQELITCCQTIIKKDPEQAEARFMLGIALSQSQQWQASIEQLNWVVIRSPENVNALNVLGIAFEHQSLFEKALNYYECALKLVPGSIPLQMNIADLHRKMGDTELAISQLETLADKQPANVNILNNLATAYSEKTDFNNAKKYWKKALQLQANNPQILNNLSILFYKNHDIPNALKYAEKSFQIAPDHPNVLNNYANCLAANNQHNDAIPLFKKAIQIAPNFVEAIQNLGFAYHNIGDFKSAYTQYNEALRIDPQNKFPLWQRSMTNLLLGDLKQGWQDYEIGLEIEERLVKSSSRETWNLNIGNNAKVLVTIEQGIGDQIMFVSCLPDLINKTSDVILECEPRLAPLFQRSFPSVEVLPVSSPTDVTEYNQERGKEYQIAMGSLPHLFRNKLEDFPRANCFLQAKLPTIDKWKSRFLHLGEGLKIGISWRAGVLVDHKKRTIPINDLLPVLQTSNCHFVNLQYGKAKDCEEFNALIDEHNVVIHEWDDSDSHKNLDDFAAKISALDLVISVGNANVHLAGALGTPVWCLIPYVPSWRWMFNGTESPWYPSVKIYRQEQLNQWDPVISKVQKDLQKLVSS